MTRSLLLVGSGLALITALGGLALAQTQGSGTATYWMTADTTSGLAAMAGGQSGAVQRSLVLQLGASSRPAAAPSADHLPPAGLGMGPALPLVSPAGAPASGQAPGLAGDGRVQGRMLLFWGCGDRAGAGQPLVVDLARPAASGMTAKINVQPERGPAPGASAAFGAWPNARSSRPVPATGSLVGEHRVQANYAPEIRFALNGDQDFMGPLQVTQNAETPAGAVLLGWAAVRGAQAYSAQAMGASESGDVAMWVSSAVQASPGMIPDYLSAADIARLIGQRVLMPAQTTTCAVPREFVKAAPDAMFQMTAYGREANFRAPPKPGSPNAAPEWTAKVRYKSAASGLLGLNDEPDPDEDAPEQEAAAAPAAAKPMGRSLLRGLGALGRAIP